MYPTAPQANKNPFRFLGLRLWAHFLVRRTVCSFKNPKMYGKAVELLACSLTKTLGPHASTQNVLFAQWWLWGIGRHKTCVLSKAEWGWQTEFVDPKYPFVSGLVGRMHFVDSHAWLRRFITCYDARCFAGSLSLKKNGSHPQRALFARCWHHYSSAELRHMEGTNAPRRTRFAADSAGDKLHCPGTELMNWWRRLWRVAALSFGATHTLQWPMAEWRFDCAVALDSLTSHDIAWLIVAAYPSENASGHRKRKERQLHGIRKYRHPKTEVVGQFSLSATHLTGRLSKM